MVTKDQNQRGLIHLFTAQWNDLSNDNSTFIQAVTKTDDDIFMSSLEVMTNEATTQRPHTNDAKPSR